MKRTLNLFPVNSVGWFTEDDDCDSGDGGFVTLGVSERSPEEVLEGFYQAGWSRLPVPGMNCSPYDRICATGATRSLHDTYIYTYIYVTVSGPSHGPLQVTLSLGYEEE